jgi:site-specific recombinase XerC
VVSGPDTSTTTDIKKLMRIRTLYVESIDNSLSDKLVESIGKGGRFRLVTKAKEADATLRGSCLESRRLKHVHSEVFISDRSGGSIWQDNIYRPFNPPALDKAVSDTATLVEEHLEQTIRDADRRR